MRTDELDYELPAERIAQLPSNHATRPGCCVDKGEAQPTVLHAWWPISPLLLDAGDLVVLNTTRVLAGTGSRVPRRRVEPARYCCWRTRATGGGRRCADPPASSRQGPSCDARRCAALRDRRRPGRRTVGPATAAQRCSPLGADERDLLAALDSDGEMPLPPYITEPLEDPDPLPDDLRRRPASAAAPTAGLHITAELLTGSRSEGIRRGPRGAGGGSGHLPAGDHRAARGPSDPHRALPGAEATWHQMTRTADCRRVGWWRWAPPRPGSRVGGPHRRPGGADLAVHHARVRVPGGRPVDDELPPAALVAAGDDPGVRRATLARALRQAIDERYRFLSFGDAMLLNARAELSREAAAVRLTSRRPTVAARGAASCKTTRGRSRCRTFMPVGTRGTIRALSTHELAGLPRGSTALGRR